MPGGCCCVAGCSKKIGHRFPKDKQRCKQWMVAVRRDNWQPTIYSIVCPDHFLPSDYHNHDFVQKGAIRQRRILKKDAVPSVFLWSKGRTPAQQDRQIRGDKRYKADRMKVKSECEKKIAEGTLVRLKKQLKPGVVPSVFTWSKDEPQTAANISQRKIWKRMKHLKHVDFEDKSQMIHSLNEPGAHSSMSQRSASEGMPENTSVCENRMGATSTTDADTTTTSHIPTDSASEINGIINPLVLLALMSENKSLKSQLKEVRARMQTLEKLYNAKVMQNTELIGQIKEMRKHQKQEGELRTDIKIEIDIAEEPLYTSQQHVTDCSSVEEMSNVPIVMEPGSFQAVTSNDTAVKIEKNGELGYTIDDPESITADQLPSFPAQSLGPRVSSEEKSSRLKAAAEVTVKQEPEEIKSEVSEITLLTAGKEKGLCLGASKKIPAKSRLCHLHRNYRPV